MKFRIVNRYPDRYPLAHHIDMLRGVDHQINFPDIKTDNLIEYKNQLVLMGLKAYFPFTIDNVDHAEQLLYDCECDEGHKWDDLVGELVFSRFDSFFGFAGPAKEQIQDLSLIELKKCYSNYINFIQNIIEYITSHDIYIKYSLIKDAHHRFFHFKKFRKDEDKLIEQFWYYIDARKLVGLGLVNRNVLEMDIGCHFLNNPDLFKQQLEVLILKGMLNE